MGIMTWKQGRTYSTLIPPGSFSPLAWPQRVLIPSPGEESGGRRWPSSVPAVASSPAIPRTGVKLMDIHGNVLGDG